MNATRSILLIATIVALGAGSALATSAQTAKDRTKYDCREVVGYKIVNRGQKPPHRQPVLKCPHQEQMAAGKCQTHWLFGMRCTE